jgi:mRNA-degrading endonuclease RelE of RelBE toxin-antitoxin system
MSYRIQIQPEAGTLLRTLAPHTVLRLGRALADLADSIEAGVSPEESTLRVDDCVLQFVVNHAHRLVEVVHVEQREEAEAPYAAAATPA